MDYKEQSENVSSEEAEEELNNCNYYIQHQVIKLPLVDEQSSSRKLVNSMSEQKFKLIQ